MRGDAATADLARIEALAQAALRRLPADVQAIAAEVVLRVVDWPDPQLLRGLGIVDPLELTGLYEGIPLTQKSVMDVAQMPDTIWLFRRPILDEWSARGDVALADLVSHILVHELAHHFGWSDEDIAAIDPWWE